LHTETRPSLTIVAVTSWHKLHTCKTVSQYRETTRKFYTHHDRKTTAIELCVSVSRLAVADHRVNHLAKEVGNAGRQHWDPSETQEKDVGGATYYVLDAGFPPPLEASTAFTCFAKFSLLEELSSELKSSTMLGLDLVGSKTPTPP